MKQLMALWGVFLAVMMTVPSEAGARELPKPKLLAVYAYADWCPNCKILSPEVAAARQEAGLDQKAVLFVTLDLTDKAKIHQSILHAQALGIGEFLKAQGSGTGYVAVLDAKSKEELFRFNRDDKAAVIAEKIQAGLEK